MTGVTCKFRTLKRRCDITFVLPDLDLPKNPMEEVRLVKYDGNQRRRVQRKNVRDTDGKVDQDGVESNYMVYPLPIVQRSNGYNS